MLCKLSKLSATPRLKTPGIDRSNFTITLPISAKMLNKMYIYVIAQITRHNAIDRMAQRHNVTQHSGADSNARGGYMGSILFYHIIY